MDYEVLLKEHLNHNFNNCPITIHNLRQFIWGNFEEDGKILRPSMPYLPEKYL